MQDDDSVRNYANLATPEVIATEDRSSETRSRNESARDEVGSPWVLAVFLGFAFSAIADNWNPTFIAIMYVVGFVLGCAVWIGVVAWVTRGHGRLEREHDEIELLIESERAGLAIARLRLERAEVEQQIRAMNRKARRFASEDGAAP